MLLVWIGFTAYSGTQLDGDMMLTYVEDVLASLATDAQRGLSCLAKRFTNPLCSAQVIPQLSVEPSVEVVNFCRTPQWFVPRSNYRYPAWVKWVFLHAPFVMRWYRNLIMARSDIDFLIFRKDSVRLLPHLKRLLSGYIKKVAPKQQITNLIPDYPPGCKRLIVDPGYLEALNRRNVTIKWDAIECIVEDGVKMKAGEVIPLDVIIFATGFSLEPVNIRGSKGYTIRQYFEAQGGPTAYVGSCIPGFPNLFTLLGPNVATGHASVIFSQESQIGFAIQIIKPILDGQAKSFEVTEEATQRYNAWLQTRLSKSIWTECNSYYQVAGHKQSKVFALFPGPVSLFWWLTRAPSWNEFHGVSDEEWRKQRRLDRIKKWGRLVVLALAPIMGYLFEEKVTSIVAYC